MSKRKIEWLNKENNIPRFQYKNQEYCLLNDRIEVEIGGVVYKVKSIYDTSSFMGDVLDSLMLEQIQRKAA